MDPKLSIHTPEKLWLSTGIRAMDHAFETLYRPGAAYPLQQMALAAIRDLFTYLPKCMGEEGQKDIEARGKLQIAAWMSWVRSSQ
jgi:alcohol dehydrogenase class IV